MNGETPIHSHSHSHSLDQEMHRTIISLKQSESSEHSLCLSRVGDYALLLRTEFRNRFLVKFCVSKSAKSIHLQILKPNAVAQKDKQLSKQFKEQLKLIVCNGSLGTCIPDVLVPVGLDGLHIVLQRLKDESGLVINLMIDKKEDHDAYDYSEEALNEAIAFNMARIDAYYYIEGIDELVEYIACPIISLFRAKKSRIWRLGHVGKWQVRVMVYAFLKLYPYFGFKSFSVRNLGRTLVDFVYFFGWIFDPAEIEFELHGNTKESGSMNCFLAEKKRRGNDDITINWLEKNTTFNIGPGSEIKELFQEEYRGFIEDYRNIIAGKLSDKSHFFKASLPVSEEDFLKFEMKVAKNAASMLKVKEIRKCFLDGNGQLLYTLTYQEYPGKVMHVHHAKFPDPEALRVFWEGPACEKYDGLRPKEFKRVANYQI